MRKNPLSRHARSISLAHALTPEPPFMSGLTSIRGSDWVTGVQVIGELLVVERVPRKVGEVGSGKASRFDSFKRYYTGVQ